MDDIEVVYRQYAQDVYKYLFSLSYDADLAEELTQETFLRAMKTMGNYDGSCKPLVWFCQIAKHLWYQWLAKHSHQQHVELKEEMLKGESPEEGLLLSMEKMALYQAIHLLPESMREVVHMRLTGEFSFSEIGKILNKSENWARVTFFRAKKRIIEIMEEEDWK